MVAHSQTLAAGLRYAQEATRLLFSTDFTDVDAVDILGALSGDERLFRISRDDCFLTPVARIAVKCGLCKSFG
jgi:hypothetical protein